MQLVAQWIKLYVYSQHCICCFSYSLSVQLASNFQLSSDRIDGEGAALVTVHDGVPHVIVRGSIKILGNHLSISQTIKTMINEQSLKVASNDKLKSWLLNVISPFVLKALNTFFLLSPT